MSIFLSPMVSIDDLALSEGPVGDAIEAPLFETPSWQIGRDAFRMILPSGLAFHYRRGHGTVFSRAPEVSDDEVALFFDGSVRGAIAWLGGLVPLHASAIAHDGGVYAFTGASGEGKSTLVAALANAGFSTFCDDVLVVDRAGAHETIALPGHKRLKLWRDGLALTGHAPLGAVRPGLDKFFVAGLGAHSGEALPLRRLYVLESALSGGAAITPIRGSERFTALRTSCYRSRFGAAVTEPAHYFRNMMRLAETITVRRFSRSRDTALFASGVAAIVADIRAATS
jgi:hypothetical protein